MLLEEVYFPVNIIEKDGMIFLLKLRHTTFVAILSMHKFKHFIETLYYFSKILILREKNVFIS